MATTTYLEWDDQATGANDNTWGDVLDANQTIFETAIARYLPLATTGGTTSFTSDQNRYPIIVVTGALVSNAIIVVRTAEKNWTFINNTTGAFSVRVKTLAGTAKFIPRGRATKLYCDGTNVQVIRDSATPYAAAAGTADAITATFDPVTISEDITVGYLWNVEATAANSSATPTFNPDSLGAFTIEKLGGQPLVAGDIYGAGHILQLMCSASNKVELLNPAGLGSTSAPGLAQLATTAQAIGMSSATRAVTPAGLGALFAKGTAVAGGSLIDLGDGGYFHITGSGWTCSDIDFTNGTDGRHAVMHINTSGTFTHNATTLPLPGGADVNVSSGDLVEVWQSDLNEVKVAIHRADGRSHVDTWQYVETLTASTSANLTTSNLAAYAMIRVTLRNIRPSVDDADLRVRISSDGATFLSTGYDGRAEARTTAASTSATAEADGVVTATGANAGIGNQTSDGPLAGQILFGNFNLARKTTIHSLVTYGNPSGNFRTVETQTLNDQSTAMTHIRFSFDSGSIEAGTIVIEGMR